jgi:hypothetical protein
LENFDSFANRNEENQLVRWSIMEANDQSQPLIRGTTVGEVLDANNAELKVFIENFKKEYRKQWQVRSIQ